MFTNNNCASVPLVANLDGNSNNGWGDGSWLWFIIVVFAIFGGWGNGFGGWGNGNNGGATPYSTSAVTQADLQRGFDTQSIVGKLDGITNGLSDGFYAVQTGMNGINTNILQTGYGIQQAINADTVANMQNTNALQAQLADCCCQNRESISQVIFDMAQDTCAITNTMNTNTRDIIDNQNAGFRSLLDYLCQDKIAALQAENNDLRRAASQDRQNALLTTAMTAQTNQIINAVNPAPIPAYTVPSPYGYACGCNTGCGC